jgi:hypothetical protein
MDQISLNSDLIQAVWAYLASRPFAEVANIAVPFQQAVAPQMQAIIDAKEKTEVAPETVNVS